MKRSLLLLLLFACDRQRIVLVGGDGGTNEIPGLLGLRIDPASERIAIRDRSIATATFRALGRFEDGEEDVSDRVIWNLDRALGTIEGGRFTGNGAGGSTVVRASAGAFEATAELSIEIDLVDADDVPVPHFGIVLPMDDWRELAETLKRKKVEFIIEPKIRFEGQVGEQATMFFLDPSGNALEFKGFNDFSQVFAK